MKKLILVSTAPSYHFMETAKENLNKIGTSEQIDICEKYLWNGSFKSNKDIDTYLKIMDPLYIFKS